MGSKGLKAHMLHSYQCTEKKYGRNKKAHVKIEGKSTLSEHLTTQCPNIQMFELPPPPPKKKEGRKINQISLSFIFWINIT